MASRSDISAPPSSSTSWSPSSLAPRNILSSLFQSSSIASTSSSTTPTALSGERRTIYDARDSGGLQRSLEVSKKNASEFNLPHDAEPNRQLPGVDDGQVTVKDPQAIGTVPSTSKGQANEIMPSALDKKKKLREKRVLPARMRRISSLLAGPGLEDQLLSAVDPTQQQRILPEGCVIILSTDPQHTADAFEASSSDVGMDSNSFFSDPDVARACRAKALIETPEFKLRDDSAQMAKTRGGAVRSEEDTSDATYERRHRRPDNAEKKQRRLEKERLVRDRQKLRDRIEQLRTADPRMLFPIIAAREQHKRQDASVPVNELDDSLTSTRGAEAAMGLGKQNMSAEATANLKKVETLRQELIAEATETLLRYDALLTDAHASTGHEKRKRSDVSDSVDQTVSEDSPLPHSSSRGRLHVTLARNKDSQQKRSPSVSTSRQGGTSARPLRHGDGNYNREVTRIHARTSGGKFAPKAAIGTPGVAAVSPPATKGRRCGSREDTSPPVHTPRPPRPSELRQKAAKEAERARLAALRGDGSDQPSSDSTLRKASGSGRGRRSISSQETSPAPAILAFLEHRRAVNRTGPSLAQLDTADRRPRRVKLRLGARPSDAIPSSDVEHEQEGLADITSTAVIKPTVRRRSAEEEVETRLLFAAPGALSLEQAQAMMAAAMARASGASIPDDLVATATDASDMGAKVIEEGAVDANPNVTAKPTVDPSYSSLMKAEADEGMPMSANATALPSPSPVNASPLPVVSSSHSPAVSTSSNKYDSYSLSPAVAYMPGRSAAARERAAANIPSRRSSGRVKELCKGAFGEKVPARASLREDFGKSMLDAFDAWGGDIGIGRGGNGSGSGDAIKAEGKEGLLEMEDGDGMAVDC